MKIKYFVLLILFTSTSKAQWKKVNNFSGSRVLEVSDSNRVILSGHGNSIYYSMNNGTSFDTFQTNYSNAMNFIKVQFITKDTGFACGGEPFSPYEVLIQSTDGGITWDEKSTGCCDAFKEMYFLNSRKGFFQSSDKPKYTNNAGINFKYVNNLLVYKSVYTYNFLDSLRGYSVGIGVGSFNSNGSTEILKTNDGGLNWVPIFIDSPNIDKGIIRINKLQFVDTINGYGIGYKFLQYPSNGSNYPKLGGSLFMSTHNGGASWSINTLTEPDSLNFNDLSDMYFVNAEIGYIIKKGLIFKTTNKGKTWTNQKVENNDKLSKFKFNSEKIAYAIGGNGLYKTINGGNISIDNSEATPKIEVYPNPSNTILKINTEQKNLAYKIFNNLGQIVTESQNLQDNTIIISNLVTGHYFLKLYNNSMTFNQKFLKN